MTKTPLDPPRQGHGLALALERLAQHDELVSTEPGDGVGRPQDGTQAARASCDEEVVTGAVPQAVVDVLETVDVYEEHRQQAGHPAEAADGTAQAVHEQAPGWARPVSGSKRALRMSWLS